MIVVAKTGEWKLGKIIHEFDASLDVDPELRSYAEMTADLLDREAGKTYPTSIRWSARAPSRALSGDKQYVIHAEVLDTNLGVSIGHDFTLEELKGRYCHFEILHLWTDFLQLRQHELIDRVFPPNDSSKDM